MSDDSFEHASLPTAIVTYPLSLNDIQVNSLTTQKGHLSETQQLKRAFMTKQRNQRRKQDSSSSPVSLIYKLI